MDKQREKGFRSVPKTNTVGLFQDFKAKLQQQWNQRTGEGINFDEDPLAYGLEAFADSLKEMPFGKIVRLGIVIDYSDKEIKQALDRSKFPTETRMIIEDNLALLRDKNSPGEEVEEQQSYLASPAA